MDVESEVELTLVCLGSSKNSQISFGLSNIFSDGGCVVRRGLIEEVRDGERRLEIPKISNPEVSLRSIAPPTSQSRLLGPMLYQPRPRSAVSRLGPRRLDTI